MSSFPPLGTILAGAGNIKGKTFVYFKLMQKIDLTFPFYKIVHIFMNVTDINFRIKKFNFNKYFFIRAMISNTPWEMARLEYDIFCLHTMWNQVQIKILSIVTYIQML